MPTNTDQAPVLPVEQLASLTREELAARFASLGQPAFRAGQVLDWVYRKRVTTFDRMTDLPAALRTVLAERFDLGALALVRRLGAEDTTQKFLFRLTDGQLVETGLIPASPPLYGEASDRRTLCISSQVGCAYGCKFCASGLDGWTRHLQPGEIVEQILRVEAAAGERVKQSRLHGHGRAAGQSPKRAGGDCHHQCPVGWGLGARHITVSTSGLAPQIRQLAEQPLQIRLAISLHGATDEVRGQIMR